MIGRMTEGGNRNIMVMAKIESNIRISSDMFVMKVEGEFAGRMGQFYMLRGWSGYPVLSRPISIHDRDKDGIRFLYRVVGEGTELLSRMRPGDDIGLEGPYGNGFPEPVGRLALVGGGMGVAPLYYAARLYPHADAYFGFSREIFAVEEFQELGLRVKAKLGGSIVEDFDPSDYDTVFSCGPELMMEELARKVRGTEAKLFVSIEQRMACGIGACLVCTCRTKDGNRKVCKDGPVFAAEEVLLS